MSKNAKIILICSIIGALAIGTIIVALVLGGKDSGKEETAVETGLDFFGGKKAEATEVVGNITGQVSTSEFPERKTEAATEAKTEKKTTEKKAERSTEQTTAAKKPEGAGTGGASTSEPEVASMLAEIIKSNKTGMEKYESVFKKDSVGIADLNKDGKKDILFVTADGYDYGNVYMFEEKNGKANLLCSQEQFDVNVASGTSYTFFLTKDGTLYSTAGIGDEDWTTTLYRYDVNSDGTLTKVLLVEINDRIKADYSGYETSYEKNGETISKEDYQKLESKLVDNVSSIVLGKGGAPEKLRQALDGLPDASQKSADALKKLKKQAESGDKDKDTDKSGSAGKSKKAKLPKDLPDCFLFCSGAGAWQTSLVLKSDGTFSGSYFDMDMGDGSEKYPGGTTYISEFRGSFKNIKKLDDYTYRMELDTLVYNEGHKEEYIENNVRYIPSDPYGVAGGKTFYLYLPGKPISELSDAFLGWVFLNRDTSPKKLEKWGLYNEEMQEGFSS